MPASNIDNTTSKVTSKSSVLILRIAKVKQRIKLSALCDRDVRQQIDERIQSNYGDVDVFLGNALDWSENVRLEVLVFLAEHDGKVTFYAKNKVKAGTSLFEAVLELVSTDKEIKRFETARIAALETAALLYPNALDAACDRILARLRDRGMKGVSRRDLLSHAKRISKEVDRYLISPVEDSISAICELFPDLSVDEPLVVPAGWRVSDEGIARRDEAVTIPTPVVISSRQKDLDEDTEFVTLTWMRDGKWKSKTVARGAVANTRSIVEELAPYGLPVTSVNAKTLVQYLTDFEATNLSALRTALVTARLGWHFHEGITTFLLGKQHLIPQHTDANMPAVEFRGEDTGNTQIAEAFYCEGTLDEWINAVRKVRHYPQIMLAIFSSMTAPLLEIFNSPNFLVSFAAPTSSGKSVTLRAATSVWGNPNEQKQPSVLRTWSGTATWRERFPAVLNNLPFVLDDTKHATRHDEVGKTVYGIAQGVGKGRGTVKGIAGQSTWRTVGMTSGEQPLTRFTEDGGTRARVVSCWGSPFKTTSAETGKLVRATDTAVRKNFGHAGRSLIQFVLNNDGLWCEWQEEYQSELSKFEEWAAEMNNPFAGRMATHFAAITTTAWIAHQALQLPWEYSDPIEPLWDELVQEAGEANRAAQALRYVMEWAWANQQDFHGRATTTLRPPAQGWLGRWDKGDPHPGKSTDEATWEWIGIFPEKLKAVLSEGGFEADAIIRTWKDENWLVIDSCKDGQTRRTKKARVGEEKSAASLIAIKRTAIEQVFE